MLKLFLKRGKGSISVFVTVIMVPVVFFIGFLVDLSRIKFCGNQAVMAADNYGEAILTDYDNLLKELYGLFALTQNKEGTEALDRLDDYVKEYYMTSFHPNDNRIGFGHLQEFTAPGAYEGWMPYQGAEVEFEAKPVEGAVLSNSAIFSTQIGEFMKFRIVQTVGDDEDGILDAIASIQNMNNDIKAVDKRNEISDKASEVLEAARDYYVQLEALWQYPDYIGEINKVYEACRNSIDDTLGEGRYSAYKAYMDEDPQAIADALEHREEIEEAEEEKAQLEAAGKKAEAAQVTVGELSEAEEKLCEIDDEYTDKLGHSPAQLESAFVNAAEKLTAQIEWKTGLRTEYGSGSIVTDHEGKGDETVNFDNFDQKALALQNAADTLVHRLGDLNQLRSQLEDILQGGNITEELKNGIKDEMREIDKLFGGEDGYYVAENYRELADHIASYSGQNSAYRQQAASMLESITERGSECIYSHPEQSALPGYAEQLDEGRLGPCGSFFVEMHDTLQDCFGDDSGGSTKSQAEEKQNAAGDMLESVKSGLDNEEVEAGEREIPSGGDFAGMGDSGTAGKFNISDMIKSAATLFESNGLQNAMEGLEAKLFLIQYDFGMFTSRVTNVEDTKDVGTGESGGAGVQTSLTGYPMAPNINYLYQAEIEYLLGGHNSSKENLNEARNKILAFRAVMNYVSTYTVEPIDTAIKAASNACAAVPTVGPILKVVVAGALRLAVAGVETYGDWTLLKKGEAVCVLKREMGDLSVMELPGEFADGLKSLCKDKDGKEIDFSSGTKSNDIKLDYEQYCLIMMLFLTNSEALIQRSADLVTLNVNTVKQQIGSHGTLDRLEFKMDHAVTAVDVTCAVHLDLVVMPKGFAKSTVDADTYRAIEEFENNTYKYTVTRGY